MRHLMIIIDLSEAMLEKDLRPTRLICTIKLLRSFIKEYFDQNPISQLGLLLMTDKQIERLTELSGNPRYHLAALDELESRTCQGEPSLQNALITAESKLKYLSTHSTREVIVIVASQTSCDPGDIHKTIQSLVNHKITVSVISLAVEVFLYHALAKATHGTFHVVLDALHFRNILQEKVPPPTVSEETQASLIKMGFPNSESFDLELYPNRSCICHLNNETKQSELTPGNYPCPRCKSVYCELPTECQVCGLTLVAAPHLARAYHHLFPLSTFAEREVSAGEICAGCSAPLENKAYTCPKCQFPFCTGCDMFLHESVHSCPTCTKPIKT
ncbi:General transcription factor IIH subunit 2 [Cichlidogyrus casuarinus]|uniref:General transcription factor IIH subunit 2 n=1 Tax=Cichlidogyrus casuarinus TaxID=1844966 RepID=A0ABD2PNG8_9PLAT